MDVHSIQFLQHAEDEDGTPYVLVPLVWVEWVSLHINSYIDANAPGPSQDELMQQAADNNRVNAATKFPQLYQRANERWYDADEDPVVFTPYGYRKEKEVHDELHG